MDKKELDEDCVSCYYARVGVKDGHNILECRFNAPRWNSGVGTGFESSLFPLVFDGVWCREYREHEWMSKVLENAKEA